MDRKRLEEIKATRIDGRYWDREIGTDAEEVIEELCAALETAWGRIRELIDRANRLQRKIDGAVPQLKSTLEFMRKIQESAEAEPFDAEALRELILNGELAEKETP